MPLTKKRAARRLRTIFSFLLLYAARDNAAGPGFISDRPQAQSAEDRELMKPEPRRIITPYSAIPQRLRSQWRGSG